MKDIRYMLAAWGNWSGSRIGTEYQAAWPIATASSDIRPMLSDEDGEIVDRAVGRLKYFDRGCKIICVNGIFSKTFKGLQNAYQQRSY